MNGRKKEKHNGDNSKNEFIEKVKSIHLPL